MKSRAPLISLGAAAILAGLLGACTPQRANTIGPYDPAALGRTDCAFSVRVEHGGRCPVVPVPTQPVVGVATPPVKPVPKGCGFMDYVSNGFGCPPPQVAPGEEDLGPPPTGRYCYRTRGQPECYDQPSKDPNRQPL